MRVADFFDAAVEKYQDQTCLIFGKESLSYKEVQSLSSRAAKGWQSIGVKPGDRVMILSPNSSLAYIGMLSLQRIGAVIVPQNPRTTLAQIHSIAQRFNCNFLLVDQSLVTDISEVKASLLMMRSVVLTDGSGTNVASLRKWFSEFDESYEQILPDSSRVVRISTTSGTSGEPKGIVTTELSHEIVVATILTSFPYNAAPVYLVAAPLSHVAGHLIMAHLVLGGTIVLIERADPDALIKAIEEHAVTTVFIPPTVLYRLLAKPDLERNSFVSMRYMIIGGAPSAVSKLADAINRIGPVIAQFYAQGEAPAVITLMTSHDYLDDSGRVDEARLASCGRDTLFMRTTILDDEGRILEAGEAGEIAVRGNNLMKGYLDAGQISPPERIDGWQRTGDIGYKDKEGFLFVVDRKKDMIISGGFNVFPTEVEVVVLGHPDVEECAVIGIPDEEWGEAVKAVVQCKPTMKISEAELMDQLISRCRLALGPIKSPKSVECWAEIPRSPVGKVLRRQVREHFWRDASKRI
jgi:acyl-CoA synthetase (AMP-forming)/AMP-acid ligase II